MKNCLFSVIICIYYTLSGTLTDFTHVYAINTDYKRKINDFYWRPGWHFFPVKSTDLFYIV